MKTRILLAASAVALLVFPAQAAETKKNDADTYRLLNLFGDVFERVRSDYVEAPTDQQMIEAAITGIDKAEFGMDFFPDHQQADETIVMADGTTTSAAPVLQMALNDVIRG